MAAAKNRRIPWEDRFSLPTDAEVVSHFTRQQVALVNAARRMLGGVAGGQESLRWFGVPWRWAFSYESGGAGGGAAGAGVQGGAKKAGGELGGGKSGVMEEGAIGYVIPSMPNPQVVVTMRLSALGTLSPKRLTRPMREAITRGTMVGERIWARWELVSKEQIEEISMLLAELERCERVEARSDVG